MKNNPSYGVEGFEYHTAKDVTFGKTGNRFIDGFQPETWMIRAVRLKLTLMQPYLVIYI